MSSQIVKLGEDVIRKIAAGEILKSPHNAIKELIENSIDAGATQISIVVSRGGLKQIQIHDNGGGIRLEDFPLLCARYATSKIREFEDLQTLVSYGFRGEALASISCMGAVQVLSRTRSTDHAYYAEYDLGGVLRDPPRSCAGNIGTSIHINDLFANLPGNLCKLGSPSEEYARVLDIVKKYAIEYAGSVSISCKQGAKEMDLSTSLDSKQAECVQEFFGTLKESFVPFSRSCDKMRFKAAGLLSMSASKPSFVLFVNRRLVESPDVLKRICLACSAILRKSSTFFMYLSLSIDPSFLDVNIHPTKQEVRIVNEDAICKAIGDAICERFSETRETRILALNAAAVRTSSESELTTSSVTTPFKRKYADHSARTLNFYSYSTRAKAPNTPSALSSEPEVAQKPGFRTQDLVIRDIYCQEELGRFKSSCIEQSDKVLVEIMKFFVFIGHMDCGDVLFQHDLSLYRLSLFSIRLISSLLEACSAGITMQEFMSNVEDFIKISSDSFSEHFAQSIQVVDAKDRIHDFVNAVALAQVEHVRNAYTERDIDYIQIDLLNKLRTPVYGYSQRENLITKVTDVMTLYKTFERC